MIARTRAEAQRLRQSQYYTGNPCKHGHLANRFTSGSACVRCSALANKRYNKRKRGAAAELTEVLRVDLEALKAQWRKEWERELVEERKARQRQWKAEQQGRKAERDDRTASREAQLEAQRKLKEAEDRKRALDLLG